MRHRRLVGVLTTGYLTASIGWALTVPAAALVASRAHAGPFLYVAAMVVYGAGGVLCHQHPARSFHPWGVQMPVCARCMGIYGGAALASLAALIALRGRNAGARTAAARVTPPAFVLAAAPTVLTLVFEWWSGQMPSHWTRAAAGVPLGAIVTAVVVAAASDQVN